VYHNFLSAGGPDPDAVLSALKGLVTDKATKAELDIIRQQLLEALESKAPLSDMRALAAAADRAATEAAAAADAAAAAAAASGLSAGAGTAPVVPEARAGSTGDHEGSTSDPEGGGTGTPPVAVQVSLPMAGSGGSGFVVTPDQWETLQRQLMSRATRAELDALSNQVGIWVYDW
jgi:flagellar hook-length control protein FliK